MIVRSCFLCALVAVVAMPVGAAETSQIQVRLDTAKRLFDSELPADALEILEAVAVELGPEGESGFPLLRFMMARCLIALDRPEDALGALARFEALARDDAERELATEWRAKVLEQAFGTLVVHCPEGAVARIGDGEALSAPCPATFEQVRAGAYRVQVEGSATQLVADVEVVANQSVDAHPVAPVPDPPWWWVGATLSGGAALFAGGLPDFVDPGVGPRLSAEIFGDLAVHEFAHVRLGFGYTFEEFAYTDTDIGADGTWTRSSLVAPLAVRVPLPHRFGVALGGGVEFLLDGEETRGAQRFDVNASFSALSTFGRLEVDYTVFDSLLDVRIGLRYQRSLTPLFEEADAMTHSVDLAVQAVY